MFTIKNTHSQDITWPNLVIVKGENQFPSRAVIPAELWSKLDRFRSLGLLAFEGSAEAGKAEPMTLEGLKETDLSNMSRAELIELAHVAKVSVSPDADKTAHINAIKVKLPGYVPADAPPAAGSGTSVVDPAQSADMKKTHDAIASARATRAVDVANKG